MISESVAASIHPHKWSWMRGIASNVFFIFIAIVLSLEQKFFVSHATYKVHLIHLSISIKTRFAFVSFNHFPSFCHWISESILSR